MPRLIGEDGVTGCGFLTGFVMMVLVMVLIATIVWAFQQSLPYHIYKYKILTNSQYESQRIYDCEDYKILPNGYCELYKARRNDGHRFECTPLTIVIIPSPYIIEEVK